MSDELRHTNNCYSMNNPGCDCGMPDTPPPTDAEREELRYALWNAMHPDNDIDVLTDALLASGWRKGGSK